MSRAPPQSAFDLVDKLTGVRDEKMKIERSKRAECSLDMSPARGLFPRPLRGTGVGQENPLWLLMTDRGW